MTALHNIASGMDCLHKTAKPLPVKEKARTVKETRWSVEEAEEPEGDFVFEAEFDVIGCYETVGDVADLSENGRSYLGGSKMADRTLQGRK